MRPNYSGIRHWNGYKAASNEEPCGSLNDDGCLQIFPRFDGIPGSLCMKCKKIQAADTDEQRQSIQSAYKSCEGCGLCSTQLREALCGKCKRKEDAENGIPDPKAIGAAERREKLNKRVGNPSPLQQITNSGALPGPSTTGPSTPAKELEAIRAVKSGSTGLLTVNMSWRLKGAVDKGFGTHSFIMAYDTHLDVVLEVAVEYADIQWLKDQAHQFSLKPEDCDLRFRNNAPFAAEAKSLHLKGLILFYSHRPDKIHVTAPNKLGLAVGSYVALECVIDLGLYKARVNRIKLQMGMDDDESLPTRKRKNNESMIMAPEKRPRLGNGTLYSSVRITNNLGALGYNTPSVSAPTVDVTFKKLHAVVSDDSAALSPDPGKSEFSGRMETKPLILSVSDRGKSKDVFKLFIDGDQQPYVAKMFFDIGQGSKKDGNIVSKADNARALGLDLFRLNRLAIWRSNFMELAATRNFSEVADFDVSPGFLVRVRKNSVEDSDDDEPTTYLVEPFRSTSVVRKFSGTLGATQDTDKMALTMLSFSHFIMEFTACAMSMVDLQGSLHAEPGAIRRMTLFDPMSHTLEKNSGVGDFGVEGIEDSIETHQCSIYCKALGLVPMEVLKATLERQKGEIQNNGSDNSA
ncbi:kinase-like domain-containing protein [Mycena belliarum]|uniref:Kinase-like domain-containing protein n=1 Tax=Mycena belliarum TaxID=1033014 RepID=A0AAD6U2A0_9AGAR|nr:kinase-like domain-containing protein [Mycena belliae]